MSGPEKHFPDLPGIGVGSMYLRGAAKAVQDLCIVGNAVRGCHQIGPASLFVLVPLVPFMEGQGGVGRRQRPSVIDFLGAVCPDGQGSRVHHQSPAFCDNVFEMVCDILAGGIKDLPVCDRIGALACIGLGSARGDPDGKDIRQS